MSNYLTRRLLLTSALSAAATVTLADAPSRSLRPNARTAATPVPVKIPRIAPELRTTLMQMIAEANLGGPVGVMIADARTGEVLEAVDSHIPLPPASVTKSFTALYALETLGAAFRFPTCLMATAPVLDGVMNGDLILLGQGNPNLITDEVADLVARLEASGLRKVNGNFYVWGAALPYSEEIDVSQLDHLGYNPSLAGLNLNFNRVHFEWKRAGGSYSIAMDARSEFLRPNVTTSKIRVVDRAAPVYTFARDGALDSWTVAKGALGDSGSRWLPVRNPAVYCGDVFQTLARAQGIALKKPVEIANLPAGAREIVSIQSESLRDMMQSMLLYSTNITAEAAGLRASTKANGAQQDLKISAELMADWANARAGTSTSFVDHSGLSDLTAVSAGDMVRFLTAGNAEPVLRPIMKRITMLDAERNQIPGYPNEVRAKTGTLNFVSTLAGYIRTSGDRDLAFAIFAADPVARARGKASNDERPQGSISWNSRAKRLQQLLLQRWGLYYGPEQASEG